MRNTALAPAVSNPATFAGIVRVVRNQMNDTRPPPRLTPRSAGGNTGPSGAAEAGGSAWGSRSLGDFESGSAVGSAGHSTVFASSPRHRAPNAADPASVIRSTTCEGGIDGARGGCGWSTAGTVGGTHAVGRTYLAAGIGFRPAGSP